MWLEASRVSWLTALGLLMAWWVVASLAVDVWERLGPRAALQAPAAAGPWARVKTALQALEDRAPLVPRSVVAMRHFPNGVT